MPRAKQEEYAVKRLRLPLSNEHIADLTALQTCLYDTPASLTRKNLEQLIRSRRARIFVAVDTRGHIVAKGTGSLVRIEEGLVGWYYNIVVSKSHRRRGLMKAIHREILKFFRQSKVDSICVSTHRLRRGARKFYKSVGFKESRADVLVFPL